MDPPSPWLDFCRSITLTSALVLDLRLEPLQKGCHLRPLAWLTVCLKDERIRNADLITFYVNNHEKIVLISKPWNLGRYRSSRSSGVGRWGHPWEEKHNEHSILQDASILSILVIMTVNFCLCNMDYHRYNILFRILANSVSFSIATSLSLPLPYSTTFDLSFLKLSALISSVFPQQSRTLYMNWSTSIKVNQLGLGFSQENYNLSTIRLKLIMHPLSSQILFMIG